MPLRTSADPFRRDALSSRTQNGVDDKAKIRYAVLFGAAVTVSLYAIWYARVLLLLLFAGVLTAVLLATCANAVEQKLHWPRRPALVLVCCLAAVLLVGSGWLLGPSVLDQYQQLQWQLPRAGQTMLSQLREHNLFAWVLSRVEGRGTQPGDLVSVFRGVSGLLGSLTSALAAGFVIAFISLYLALDPTLYVQGFQQVIPEPYRARAQTMLAGATDSLRRWLLAKLCSMLAVGLLVGLGLTLLGIPLAGTLALVAGLLTFIPNLGPILSAAPAALLGFASGSAKGISVLALYGGVHFVEGNLITPLLEKSIVKLPPALTLFLQLLLALATGALGVALAAPLAAAVMGIVSAIRSAEADGTYGPLARESKHHGDRHEPVSGRGKASGEPKTFIFSP